MTGSFASRRRNNVNRDPASGRSNGFLPASGEQAPEALPLLPLCFAILPVVLQFLTVPFFGDVDLVGKGLVGAFLILGLLLPLLGRLREVSFSPALLLLAAAWGGLFLSATDALHPPEAFISLAFLAVLILFAAIVTHLAVRHPGFPCRLIDALLFSGVIAASLGLYEYARYALHGRSRAMVISYLLPPDANVRVDGIFGQPNLFALFLTLVLLGFFFRYPHLPLPDRPILRALRYLPVVLAAMVLFLTGSRGGMLSFALVFMILCALAAKGGGAGNREARKTFVCLCLAVGAGFLSGYLISSGYLTPAGTSAASASSDRLLEVSGRNSDNRLLLWMSALAIFADHPWLGIGLDNFKLVSVSYLSRGAELLGYADYDSFGFSQWTHNEVLQLLCEGGLVAIFPVLILLAVFCFLFFKNVWRSTTERSPLFIYSHLFILPFILQSMLEWPLRHTSLLILFFAFVGLLMAQYGTKRIQLKPFGRKAAGLLVAAGIFWTCSLAWQETAAGSFYRTNGDGPGTPQKLAALEEVCRAPFTELRVLREAVPRFTELAMRSDDDRFARGLIPFAERLTRIQSQETHWLNLALLYYRSGENEKASAAVQNAIDLRPDYGIAWSFQHYLNMLAASRATGRPVEEFYPHPPGGHYEVPELFRVGN